MVLEDVDVSNRAMDTILVVLGGFVGAQASTVLDAPIEGQIVYLAIVLPLILGVLIFADLAFDPGEE